MSASLNIIIAVAISAFIALSTSSSDVVYDVKIVPEHCLNAEPIESNYTATGTTYLLNNMTVYETVNKTNKRVLIAVYDIFGLHNNTKQVVDKLADGFGFKIAMPDYFRGPAWDEDNFPPSDPQELQDWLQEVGNWERTVRDDTAALMNHYRTTENVTEFGIFGFCWGGKIATQAASYFNVTELRAGAMIHPSSVANDEAEGVQVPMYLLPTQNEPNMLPFYVVLQRKFGTNCGHRRFDDMFHGFSGARGNFSNPLNRLRVDEVIQILGTFFDRNLVN